MLTAHLPGLADGEIELVAELPPSDTAAARAEAHFQRLRKDARTLDALLADSELNLTNEWIAVFDGEVFRAGAFEALMTQFDAHGVDAGGAVKHYVRDDAVRAG